MYGKGLLVKLGQSLCGFLMRHVMLVKYRDETIPLKSLYLHFLYGIL